MRGLILRIIIFLLFVLFITPPSANAGPVWQWAKRLGGTSNDNGQEIAIDSNGNVVVVGYIRDNSDVNGDGDSTDGGAEDATGYANNDILISVFDSSGNWQWAKRLGGTGAGSDDGHSVAIDSNDNIIVATQAYRAVDVNGDGDSTDGGAESYSGYNSYDALITVFDSSGNWQWAKRLGGTSQDFGYGVAVDNDDNIIFTGGVTGNADLNGDGDSTDGGAEDATGYGYKDIFVSVFDSSGNWQWAKRLGGTENHTELGDAVATDSNNNIIIVGQTQENADMNGDGDNTDGGAESATGYGSLDIFVSVFNSSGTWQWAKRLGGTSGDYGHGAVVDSNDRIIVSGRITGNADVNGDGDSTDGGAEDSTGYAGTDILLSVFNSSGTWQWAKRLGATGNDAGYNFNVDSNDNILVAGNVDGDADVNGDGDSTDGGAEDATGYGSYDILLSSFSSSGTWRWAERLGGSGYDAGFGVAVDSSDNIVTTGYINGDVDINGDGDTTDGGAEDSTGYGSADIFISYFSPDTTAPSLSMNQFTDTTDNTPALTGTATDASGTVASVEAQTDSTTGTWTTCTADDGAFDEASETFTCQETELSDGTHTVYFRSTDDSSNLTDSGSYFTGQFTIDANGPTHSDVRVASIKKTSFTVTWTTNETGSSRIEYGPTSNYGQSTAETDTGTRVTSHSATVTGLTKCTVYHFRTKSSDSVVNTTTSGNNTITTSGCSGSDIDASGGEAQITEAGSGGVVSSQQESAGGSGAQQTVTAVIEANTLQQDAYFSSRGQTAADIVSTANLTSNSSFNQNVSIAGGDSGIIGITTSSGIAWQVGPLQKLHYKTVPPVGSGKESAIIIPELQARETIVAFSYTNLDLIPPGNPTTTFNPSNFKIARSLDGITWTILESSVVDTVNQTVAALDRVYGYYMIVAPTSGFTETFTTGAALGASTRPTLVNEVPDSVIEQGHDDFNDSFVEEPESTQEAQPKQSFFQKVVGFVKNIFTR